MGKAVDCPHDRPVITTDGRYYRQVHSNDFQNGRALPVAFRVKDTGCHHGLSLHDGVRTTAQRCHREYTVDGGNKSVAVFELSLQELVSTGASKVVDSPDGISFAHVDALYENPMNKDVREGVRSELTLAANRRGPVYVPGK